MTAPSSIDPARFLHDQLESQLAAQGSGKVDDRPVCPVRFRSATARHAPLASDGRSSRRPMESDIRAGFARTPGPWLAAAAFRPPSGRRMRLACRA